MTAAEIQRRVDAWLASRGPYWTGESDRRQSLNSQWGIVTAEFGADSDAATGVLLGLVREAWGPGRCDIGLFRSGIARLDMMPDTGEWPHFASPGFGATLVEALEAAP